MHDFYLLTAVVAVIAACGIAFYTLGLALGAIPVGVAHAIWSDPEIAFIVAIGFVVFGRDLDLPAVLGLAMILGGILVINLFSNSGPH